MLTFIRLLRLTSLGLITGCLALLSNIALAANFFMDLIYGFIDPRARQNV